MKYVCPSDDCGGSLVALVSVFYERPMNPRTGVIAKRGERIGDEITNIHCTKCGAYYDPLNEGFIKGERLVRAKRNPLP